MTVDKGNSYCFPLFFFTKKCRNSNCRETLVPLCSCANLPFFRTASCHIVKPCVNQRGCTTTQKAGGLVNRSSVSFLQFSRLVSTRYFLFSTYYRSEKSLHITQGDIITHVTLYISHLYCTFQRIRYKHSVTCWELRICCHIKSQFLPLRGNKYR